MPAFTSFTSFLLLPLPRLLNFVLVPQHVLTRGPYTQLLGLEAISFRVGTCDTRGQGLPAQMAFGQYATPPPERKLKPCCHHQDHLSQKLKL